MGIFTENFHDRNIASISKILEMYIFNVLSIDGLVYLQPISQFYILQRKLTCISN